MISLDRVSKTYTLSRKITVAAVHQVSLQVERGEFVVITGRSGSGKTTLLNLMAGLTRPTEGQAMIDGVDLWTLDDPQRSLLRNRTIGFVFQFPSLMPSLTVLENVLLPTLYNKGTARHASRDLGIGLLDQVGLSDKLSVFPRQLSAGQQQRVVIARALINQPGLVLADEPTSDLDELTEQEIIQLFQSIHAELGVTLLLVTHNSDLVRYGTRSLHMTRGEIVDHVIHRQPSDAVHQEILLQ